MTNAFPRLSHIPLILSWAFCASAALADGFDDGDQMVIRIDPEASVIREIPESFLGLSFSYEDLERDLGSGASDYNTLLRDFLLRLEEIHGLPALRFGGKTALETGYAPGGGEAPEGLPHALTPDKLAAIAALLESSGAQAVFGLNTRFPGSETVFEDMANGISASIDADHLEAFELGSEPNLWEANGFRGSGYDFAAFQSETEAFLDRYDATGLTVPMVGPSMSLLERTPAEDPIWNGQATDYVSTHGGRLGAVSQLLYPFSSSNLNLLDYNISAAQASALGPLIDQAHAAGKPFWMQELGPSSNGSGGQFGFTDSENPVIWFVHNALSFIERGVDRITVPVTGDTTSPLVFARDPETDEWQTGVYSMYVGMEALARVLGKNRELIALEQSIDSGSDTAKAWATREPNGTLHVAITKRLSRGLNIRLHVPGATDAARFVETSDEELLSFAGHWGYENYAVTSATPDSEFRENGFSRAPDADGFYHYNFQGDRENGPGLLWITIPPVKDSTVAGPPPGTGTGAIQESGGLVAFEAESLTSIRPGVEDWVDHSWTAIDGNDASEGQFMRSTPDLDERDREAVEAPAMEYSIDFATTGTYNVWVRMRGIDRDSDSLHVGFETSVTGLNGIRQNDSDDWLWTGEVPGDGQAQVVVDEAGIKTFRVWPREDGVEIDRIVLSLSSDTDPANTSNSPTDGDPSAARVVQADAGENRTFADTNTFQLNGSGSTGPVAAYEWEALSGNTEFLDGPDIANPSVRVSRTGNYLFRLTVRNAAGETDEDFVTMTYEDLEAEAGEDVIALLGNEIVLDGGDSEGTVAAAQWEVVTGPALAVFGSPGSIWTTFDPAEAGVYTIRLTLTGTQGESRTDDVTLTVRPDRPIVHTDDNPFVGHLGFFAIEAEDFSAQSPGLASWQGNTWTVESDGDASGGSYVRNTPDEGLNDVYASDSPALEYPIRAQYAKFYSIRLRLRGNGRVHVGAPDVETIGNGIASTSADWHWSPPIDFAPSFGLSTLRVWPQDDGVEIDRIVFYYRFLSDPIPPLDNIPNSPRDDEFPSPPADDLNVRAIAGEDLTVTIGEEFVMDATASTGPIVEYEWILFASGVRVINDAPTLTRTLNAIGTREGLLRVTNAEGESHYDTLKVTVVPDTTLYDAWVEDFYPGETDSEILDPGADPDGDGFSNVVAFLLGTTAAERSPTQRITADFINDCFIYSYPEQAESGFGGEIFRALQFEFSHDHRQWTTEQLGTLRPRMLTDEDFFGEGIHRRVVRLEVGQMPRVFVRLCVDLP